MIRRKRSRKTTILIVVLVVLLVGGLGYVTYRYNQARQEISRLSNPQQAAEQETNSLLEEVSAAVVVPENETPTIATVNDVSKLSEQPFFKNAQNGDKVLIFTESKSAILYRPSEKKVVTVTPIDLSAEDIEKKTE